MTPADLSHLQARHHHEAGRLAEAETLYLQSLSHDPHHHGSLHWLGLLHHATGRKRSGTALLGRSVALSAPSAFYYGNLAVGLMLAGHARDMIAACRSAVMLAPDDRNGWLALGTALGTAPRMADAAAAALRRAVLPGSDNPSVLMRLGETARLAGRRALAVASYRAVAMLMPQDIHMLYNLGTVLKEAGEPEKAARVFVQAIRLDPLFGHAYYGAGDSMLRAGRPDDAAMSLKQSVSLEPARFDSLCGMARIREHRNRDEEALRWFRRATAVAPGDAVAHFNQGIILERLGRLEEAVRSYDQALEHDPLLTGAHEKFVFKLNLSLWRDYDRDVARARRFVREQGGKVLPIPFTYIPSTPAEQLLCARRVSTEAVPADATVWRRRFRRPSGGPDKPILTIGYLSGDFRDHAVAYLVAELLEVHDRKRFRIQGYSTGPESGNQPIRRRIEAAVDGMTCLRDLTAVQAAERIHDDGVDILVDLSGHTRYARTDVLALRPAPIQVNYLGYPGTLGADFMDYIIVDPFCVPAEQQCFYTERLVHLPHVYQVNDRTKRAAPPRDRAEYGLPDDGLVFCCFNNNAKITPEVFGIWMRLLHKVPDSVLWLLVFTPEAITGLRREAAAHGIDPHRLVPAPMVPQAEHLARYAVADVFLDTFPYTAHTTGSDALWMGCPLVTRIGDTFPSRVAGSLLHAFGVPELVTETPADYEALVLELARNRDRLRNIRAVLEAQRATTPAYDTPRFARHLEWAFERMWALHRNGHSPCPIRVPPLPPPAY